MTPEQLKTVKEIADRTTANFINRLPELLENKLRQAALQIIGLRDSGYNKLEVDHCNGNRSIIGNAIESRTKELVAATINPAINKILDVLSTDVSVISAIDKEIRGLYKRVFNETLEKAVSKRAVEDAQKLIDSIDISHLTIGPDNVELENPESFAGPLGQIFMEEMAFRRK